MIKVCVMMSTYNGDKYLEEQILSILDQNIKVHLYIRDDGSNDGTKNILQKYINNENIFIRFSDNLGPQKSFMCLIDWVGMNYDFYFFADQDDKWKPGKIMRAIDFLKQDSLSFAKSKLYFSNVDMTDNELKKLNIKLSFWKYDINDVLLGSAPLGCTICYNKELQNHLLSYSPKNHRMHDHWVYLVCLCMEGKIYYDDTSQMFYRQHSENVVGGTTVGIKYIKSLFNQFVNVDNNRLAQANELVEAYGDKMNSSIKRKLLKLVRYKRSFFIKMNILLSREFNTKQLKKNVLFKVSILFNRF
ncbi:MAG: glycosyltransferase [Enterococcus sp.]|uniref:glycosyltransferase n=1 Tax=Enterococcus TaxID=1350 RepID=UPI00288D0E87|nr:glycosyltransferase [Enterococcus gallinarum]MDT2684969.1 glycosyltransferase [Enterococcus gallinarum]